MNHRDPHRHRTRATNRIGVGLGAGVLIAALVASSCGKGNDSGFDPGDGLDSGNADSNAGLVDSSIGAGDDGSPPFNNDSGHTDSGHVSDAAADACGNTNTDPKNCGACGKACGSGQSCAAGKCVCAPYQTFCGGACISTNGDPANCGGCGVKCTGTQVCSAGVCDSGCLPGLSACSNTCVDASNDSNNCGSCGNKCAPGTGCAKGHCTGTVPVGPAPAKCAGGGPPIVVGGAPSNGCLGGVAQTTFDWSLCSCTDLAVSALLATDAYDSTMGPYKPGQLGGGVGVDRDVTLWSDTVTIGGTFWESGSGTYHSSGPASEVKTDMHLGGSWASSTPFTVDGNASVKGTLSGVTVKGTNNTVTSVPPACDCSPNKLVPIAKLVALAATNNDNALINLDSKVFESPGGALRLDLPCGIYYLSQINSSNAVTIAAHGHTAVFIAGDVSTSDALAFVLDASSELDIFIGGNLKASETLVIGSPNYPALSRTYVGGTDTLRLSADVRLGGELYAANAALVDWSAANDIYGAVFAGSFKASAATRIHYDRGVLGAGTPCPPIQGPDAGPPTCGSCQDCGNQACVQGACGPCTDSSQCCGPLQCQNGTCVPIIK